MMSIKSDVELNFGKQFRNFRKQKGLSQVALAKMVGISPTLISHIERNKVTPSLKTLIKLCTALNCSISSLIPEKDITKNYKF